MFEQLWEKTQKAIKSAVSVIVEGVTSIPEAGANHLFMGLNTFWKDTDESDWTRMFQFYADIGALDDQDVENFAKLKDLPWGYEQVAILQIALKMLTGVIDTYGSSALEKTRQEIWKKTRPGIQYPNEIIRAAFIAPEKTGEVREIFARYGIPEEAIDLAFLSQYASYDLNLVRELYLRKTLDEDLMYTRMRELGFTDTRIDEIKTAWDIIPPVTDILTMVSKEAFEPETISRFGLDEEFPESQLEWLEKQGLSEFWARKYWAAHWYQPSIQQGFEMLHRDVIDDEDLDHLFRAQEIPRFWRDKLTQIAYNPYTRVDVRRMHDLGVIDDSGLLQAYKDLGFNEERAENMVKFTIAYNTGSEKALSKGIIEDAYVQNLMSRKDAIDELMLLGYDEDRADYLLAYKNYKEEQDYWDEQIALIKVEYQNTLISESEARHKLAKANVDGRRIDTLIDRWEIGRKKDHKLPSKDDLNKFVLNGIIGVKEWQEEMKKLGYPNKYSDMYLKLLSTKMK